MHAQLTTPCRFSDATTGDVYVSGRRVGYFSGDDVYCDGQREGHWFGADLYVNGTRAGYLSGDDLYVDGSRRGYFAGGDVYIDGSRWGYTSPSLSSEEDMRHMFAFLCVFTTELRSEGHNFS